MIVTLLGALLVLLGIVSALILLCVLVIRHSKNRPDEDYDERQIVFQGKANEFGLIVGGIYYTILSFYLMFTSDNQTVGDMTSLLVLAGVFVVIITIQLYCMMTGALLPLNDKTNQVVGLCCFMAVLSLIGVCVHIWFNGLGMGDEPVKVWEDLIEVVFFTFEVLIYRIAKWKDQRESA